MGAFSVVFSRGSGQLMLLCRRVFSSFVIILSNCYLLFYSFVISGGFMTKISTSIASSARRQALQTSGGLGLFAALVSVGFLTPGTAAAQAFNAAAFQAKGIADTMKALGAAGAIESKDVVITASDIAENGAVVPVGVRSALPKTEMLALLVDKNPNGLAGAYDILDGAEAEVQMNIKMGQSSDVVALVKADGKFYMARKEIKVTLGGCGG
jgi:sulfur-oxidizing protein SoxY